MKSWHFRSIVAVLILSSLLILLESAIAEEGVGAPEREVIEEWREILKFGIDSEIIEVIQLIKKGEVNSLERELIEVLSKSLNSDVRIAVLDYFREAKNRAARDVSVVLLSEYDDLANSLIIALLNYLSEIGASEGTTLMVELVDHFEVGVAAAAIKALGKQTLGSRKKDEIVEMLLERINDEEFETALKQEAILSLGSLKSQRAVDDLIELMAESTEDMVARMYAADALGKIGDARAIDPLKNLFAEEDALLRAYAASALANFNPDQVVDYLIQGLRDSNWKVRVASAEGLTKSSSAKAIDILVYKAKKDPVQKVRTAACEALGKIGSPRSLQSLRDLYSDETLNAEVRIACLDVLVERDLGRSIGTIKAVVQKQIDSSQPVARILELTALRLGQAKSPALKPIYRMLFSSKNLAARVHAIRGILHNRFADMKGLLTEASKEDPHAGVRREARVALEKW
jgi:HEAT repeat protein